jgi:coenzyme F420 hydrogenase subunit beta
MRPWSMGMDRWAQNAYHRVIYDAKDLGKCAGSKYTRNAILEHIMDLLKNVNHIALVGTPCVVQAVGLMRRSSNEFAVKLAHKVRFILGLFCFEAFDDSLIQGVTGRLEIPSWRVDKMSAGEGKMTITLRDGSQKVNLSRTWQTTSSPDAGRVVTLPPSSPIYHWAA